MDNITEPSTLIKAIIFDLEDTLVKRESYRAILDRAMYQLIAEKEGYTCNKAKEIFTERRDLYPTTTRTVESFGIEKSEFHETLDSIELEHQVQLINGATSILKQLKKKTYKLGLLTNVPYKLTINILTSGGLTSDIFDGIVSGSDIINTKPSKKPFLKILKLLKTKSQNALMVGDREEVDLIPAKEVGMITVLFGQNPGFADYNIKDIYEIINILEQIQKNGGINT